MIALCCLLFGCSRVDIDSPLPAGDPPASPDGLEATDGAFPDKVVLRWDPVADAESYRIHKAIDASDAEYRIIATDVVETMFEDDRISVDRYYFFRVSAANGWGESPPSPFDRGYAGQGAPELPEPPTHVTATDGMPTSVTVAWDAVAGVQSYVLYRAASRYGDYDELASSMVECTYTDGDVLPNVRYFYAVAAVNEDGQSASSDPDEGFAVVGPPPQPSAVSATDGAFADRVRVTWESVDGADTYGVLRTNEVAGEPAEIATGIEGTSWDDDDVLVDQHYYYRVRAEIAGGVGPLSDADEGFAASGAPQPPSIPDHVSASDDAPPPILLTWDAASGASTYKVYRSDSSDGVYQELAADLSVTSYDDAAVNTEEYYYYKVSAVNDNGESSLSAWAQGYALQDTPEVPTAVSASDGAFCDRVSITWEPSARADSYKVYRADLADGEYQEIDVIAAQTNYDDLTVQLGTTYFFRVSAVNATGESELSEADEGGADLKAPTGLVASKSTGHWNTDLTWDAVDGADAYNVHRKVNLGGWEVVATGIPLTSWTAEFTYLAFLRFRVSATRSGYEGSQSEEVNRWTAY